MPGAPSPFDLALISGLILIALFTWRVGIRYIKALREAFDISQRRLAAIEVAHDGIGMVDGRGNLTYMNKALMNIHGIPPEDADQYIGRSWENIYNEKGRQQIYEHVLPVLRRTGKWQGESPLARKNGEVLLAEMSLTLLPDGGFIGTARDITGRKHAEQEKEELQRQVHHAQKMESVGRLAGGLAHDFNNILSAILGYADFLVDDLPPSSKQHHFSRQIMRASLQARHLTEQILAFSRHRETARQDFDAVETVRDVLSMLEATIQTPVHFKNNVDGVVIHGNAAQLSQALVNLCLNARDAIEDTASGLEVHLDVHKGRDAGFRRMLSALPPPENYAPEIQVFREKGENILLLGQLAGEKHYFSLCVVDKGCGMPLSVMEHIFEPFFTTKERDRGTGLGLSTTMGTLAAHQGAAIVRSREGAGSVFNLLFPVNEMAAEVREPELTPEERPARGTGHILVVEDQEGVRTMLMEMLARLGYSASSCGNGPEAIDMLREKPDMYDMVLSDYLMPGMTGLEMAREIYHDFPRLPVVFLSGYAHENLGSIQKELPSVRAVLRKPADTYSVGTTLRNILGKDAGTS